MNVLKRFPICTLKKKLNSTADVLQMHPVYLPEKMISHTFHCDWACQHSDNIKWLLMD